jgi:hypothetical protein
MFEMPVCAGTKELDNGTKALVFGISGSAG